MADEPETSGQEPNLELPRLLGFGRKKKGRKADATQADPTTEQSAPDGPEAPDTSAAVESSDRLAADPVAPPRGGLAPAAEKAKRPPPVPPPNAGTPSVSQVPPPPPPSPAAPDERAEEPAERKPPSPGVATVGDTEAEHTEILEPTTGGPETWARSEPEPVSQPAITEPPATEPPPRETSNEETTVFAAQGIESRSGAEPTPGSSPAVHETSSEVQVDEPPGWPTEEPAQDPAAQRGLRGGTAMQLPVIDPRIAAVLTGAVVGLVGVLLAFLAGRGCEAVRGVGSCGGIGLFALLLIVAIEVLIGAALLKAWRLYDPVSTSFLGSGLMAVFVLVFLLSSLDSVWMVVVIPVVSAITFLISWWVTTSFVEGSDTG